MTKEELHEVFTPGRLALIEAAFAEAGGGPPGYAQFDSALAIIDRRTKEIGESPSPMSQDTHDRLISGLTDVYNCVAKRIASGDPLERPHSVADADKAMTKIEWLIRFVNGFGSKPSL